MGLDSKKEANFGHYFVCINKLGHRKLIYVILSKSQKSTVVYQSEAKSGTLVESRSAFSHAITS